MRTLLLKPRVVDDPGFDPSVPRKRRRRKFANLRQHLFIRPRRLPYEVQQRLMRRRRSRDTIEAIGSTLLRSHAISKPVQ